MSLRKSFLILLCLAISSSGVFASTTVRRYALTVGANDGGSGRPRLRYAVSDAESFGRVMETLGGVYSSDLVLLKQPSLSKLEDALMGLRRRVDDSSAEERVQVMVYFSGHANETGLLLGDEIFSYLSLRNWIDSIDADVRIAVLDACASGAITRLKGTRRRRAFLVDTSTDTKGHAFLTSSSENEVAQESDRIGGSFFTHYLVSGLRGAADTSGEGKVTLNEAYQFAFHETLGRTAKTEAGAQHPSYDINLSGTGEVVMTDVRETSATLVLGDDLSGRFFVRNSNEQLVVELYKLRGRRVELGLEPGAYSVRCETDSGSSVSTASLQEGNPFVLRAQSFTTAEREAAVARGGVGDTSPYQVDGRWRIGMRLGSWYYGGMGSKDSGYTWDTRDYTAGVTFSHWLSEKWSLDISTWTLTRFTQSQNYTRDSTYIAAVLFGGRRYFPGLGGLSPNIKPFLSAAVGPYFRNLAELDGNTFPDVIDPNPNTFTDVAAGGNLGGGFDIQVARWCMVGTKLGYNFTTDFSRDQTEAFGDKTAYSGWEWAVDFSVLLGKGSN